MPSNVREVASSLGFALFALATIGVGGLVWGGLIYANFLTTPAVPWALPALILLLWLAWQYLGGRGWPVATSRARRTLRRANPVPLASFGWSAAAGLLAIGALAGFWIVAVQLFAMPPNPVVPDRFTSSPVLIAAIVIGASLLAPIIEECAVRGYLQTVLERYLPAASAIILSSAVFALAHITQGFAFPKLLFYFLVGVAFGTLALLNDSILPVIPVHVAGDLIFFVFIWPHDQARQHVSIAAADGWFWAHVAQMAVCGSLAVWTFRQIPRTHHPDGVERGVSVTAVVETSPIR